MSILANPEASDDAGDEKSTLIPFFPASAASVSPMSSLSRAVRR